MVTSLPRLASQYFAFLETSYGFRRILSSETTVRWESDDVFVQVRYDAHRSYEVGLEIGQLTADAARIGPPYSLSEVLGVVGVALVDRPFFQASTEERLKAALEEMARLLVHQGEKYLQDDAMAFRSLAQQRDQDCDAYAKERSLTQMREAADKAWQEHDYKAVVNLYQKQISYLTPAQTKRYEIALKNVETPTQ